MRRGLLIVLIAGAVLAATRVGQGYAFNGAHWSSGTAVVMQLELGSSSGALIDGSPDWNTVAEGALGTWNSYLNGVSFRVVRNSTAGTGIPNGVNNVIWGDDVYGEPFGAETLAITEYYYRLSDHVFTETDVIFNRKWSWNSYRGNLRPASGGGTLMDMRRVALHEFGHAMGLDHPDEHGQSVSAQMNSRISNIDGLTADDINGVAALYGAVVTRTPDTLTAGGRLTPGQSLLSANGTYRLVYQTDGNLVLYNAQSAPLWFTATGGPGNAGQAILQTDGNFVVYSAAGAPLWFTATPGNSNTHLTVQNDGDVVLFGSAGQQLWDRNTAAPGTPTPSPSPSPAPTPSPSPTPSPTPSPAPSPTPNATGTWSGRVASTSCTADGAAEGFCRVYPSFSDTLNMRLQQTVTGAVTGVVDMGGFPINVSGTIAGNRLQINGSGTYQGVEMEYRAWNTFVSDGSMTGSFTVLQYLKSGGSVSYPVALQNVTRTSTTTAVPMPLPEYDVSRR